MQSIETIAKVRQSRHRGNGTIPTSPISIAAHYGVRHHYQFDSGAPGNTHRDQYTRTIVDASLAGNQLVSLDRNIQPRPIWGQTL